MFYKINAKQNHPLVHARGDFVYFFSLFFFLGREEQQALQPEQPAQPLQPPLPCFFRTKCKITAPTTSAAAATPMTTVTAVPAADINKFAILSPFPRRFPPFFILLRFGAFFSFVQRFFFVHRVFLIHSSRFSCFCVKSGSFPCSEEQRKRRRSQWLPRRSMPSTTN